MKRIFIILTMLMTLSIVSYAQKATTTKPSVKELVNVILSTNPVSNIKKIATQNGFTSMNASVTGGTRYAFSKAVKGGKNVLVYDRYPNKKTVYNTTASSAVVRSWESQIKAMGYNFDNHFIEDSDEIWLYTKAGYPSIMIMHNSGGYLIDISTSTY